MQSLKKFTEANTRNMDTQFACKNLHFDFHADNSRLHCTSKIPQHEGHKCSLNDACCTHISTR